jgi:hypothetical protein
MHTWIAPTLEMIEHKKTPLIHSDTFLLSTLNNFGLIFSRVGRSTMIRILIRESCWKISKSQKFLFNLETFLQSATNWNKFLEKKIWIEFFEMLPKRIFKSIYWIAQSTLSSFHYGRYSSCSKCEPFDIEKLILKVFI